MFNKQKIAAAAQEIADHLQVIEHVKVLQTGQKELADAIKVMGERMRELESDMRVLKSEVKFEALKETQNIVNAVQGGLNQRIEDVAVRIALMERNNAPVQTIDAPAAARGALPHHSPPSESLPSV